MPADPQRIQSIFLAAIEAADPAARAALLTRECGDDAELRQRVAELLQAHDRSGSFLDQPAVQPLTLDAPAGQWIDRDASLTLTEQPGMRVGHYKLLQQIGEGGMGVVYMAEQEQPVRRKVALKIIKPGMDSAQVIARFEAERQALAMMDHPNIAKVLDAGTTESGRPYFVMELVYGVPITKFCDDSQLTPQQRLELFVPICQAIQHAHQKGIIHRDIKPSNVLVTMHDDKPVPKVIDFGVAKAIEQRLTEKSLFTAFGTVVGTLEYMSPEQAEMNAFGVDTRSDVYSLGVLLYELLTGTTPLERKRLREAAYTEVLRLIKEVEPQRPSVRLSSSGDLPKIAAARKTEPGRLSKLVRGEIDWIVMKCLEKDRSRRYDTASGLARDVERYLSDEPVEACPPSVRYRLSKFARKYRKPLAVAASFALILVAAAVLSCLLAVWAMTAERTAANERDHALQAEDETGRERDRALKAEKVTGLERDKAIAERERADKQAEITRAVNDFLQRDLLLQSSPFVQMGAMAHVDPDLKLRTVLDRAALQLGEKFRTQPLVEAALRHTIGMSYMGIGNYTAAQDHLEKSVQLFREHRGLEDADSIDAMETLGVLYRVQRKVNQAEAVVAQCLEARRKVNGEKHPATLETMVQLGGVYLYQAKFSQAEKLVKQVLAESKGVLGEDQVLHVQSLLAVIYRDLGKQEEAEALLVKTIEAKKRKWGERDLSLLGDMNNLATVYKNRRKYREAEALFTKCLEASRKHLTEKHPDTLWTTYRMAQLYDVQGKYDQAEDLYKLALEGQSSVLGNDAQNTERTRLELWDLYSRREKPSQADALMKTELDAIRQKEGPESKALGNRLAYYGQRLLQFGRAPAAEPVLRECLAIREKKQHDEWSTFNAKSMLGESLLGQKKYSDAGPLLLQGYEGMKQRESTIPPVAKMRPIEALLRLALFYDATGKKDKLAEVLKELEVLVAATINAIEPRELNELAWPLVKLTGRAKPFYQIALLYSEASCRLEPGRGIFLNTLGVAYYRVGNYEKALQTLQRSDSLNKTDFQASIPEDLAFLAMTKQRLGRAQEAQADLKELRERMKDPRWAQNTDALRFLREAEAVLANQKIPGGK